MGMKSLRMEQWRKINKNLKEGNVSKAMDVMELLVENSLPYLGADSTKKLKNKREELKEKRDGRIEKIRETARGKQTIAKRKQYKRKHINEADFDYVWGMFTELSDMLEGEDLLPE